MKKRNLIIAILIVFIIAIFVLWFYGIIIFNYPSNKKYPIRGVDVSSYQGNIDWESLSKQEIKFAFIKATEGSSFVDEKFKINYENARKTNIKVGAYHFFSFDSNGDTQADNFISNVPKTDDMLPPVVDIEFYGDKNKKIPDVAETQKQLSILLAKLEAYYKKSQLYMQHINLIIYI